MKFSQGLMPTSSRDVDCFSAFFVVKSDVKEVLLHLIDELMTIIAVIESVRVLERYYALFTDTYKAWEGNALH